MLFCTDAKYWLSVFIVTPVYELGRLKIEVTIFWGHQSSLNYFILLYSCVIYFIKEINYSKSYLSRICWINSQTSEIVTRVVIIARESWSCSWCFFLFCTLVILWMDIEILSWCSDRWQIQEFDKPLLAGETVCGSQQLANYEDSWSVCPRPLPSTTILPSHHQNVTATGCFPHHQPSCNVWTGGFESTWKNCVVLPCQTDGIMPSAKLLCEPVLSRDQQHLMTHIKVMWLHLS